MLCSHRLGLVYTKSW